MLHSSRVHYCYSVRTTLAGRRNFRNVGWTPTTRFAICRMSAASIAHFDRTFLARLADWLAVAVAISLPWSTTAVGITIAVWLIVLLPTLDAAAVRRELGTAAGGLPVVLWCLGLIGMLWANVDWHDRFAGLGGFHRLLGHSVAARAIPPVGKRALGALWLLSFIDRTFDRVLRHRSGARP